ncbi:4Fe-4S ferredoxin [Methanocella sp. CWC-04]|uniref:4Fe-4S ferredoxin n=1 Tax=Methanooceanicella nereidis TaxID=2052831 RepID=A0AAP2RDW4_9EURY|nr:4Fe-4S binding protein [Methanocella sp. CWC-04]MCD1294845.1 4Fe-4S ferredoxin [Methanocella sp. CWC-04]
MVVIPVNIDFRKYPVVLPFDMAKMLIEQSSCMSLARVCACRDRRECKKHSKELSCIYLGPGSKDIVKNGSAKEICKEDALSRLNLAKEEGLVSMVIWSSAELRQPGVDTGRTLELCSCCSCCCIPYRTENMSRAYIDDIVGLGAANVASPEKCAGCKICEAMCPFKAIKADGDGPVINADRCKGCGVCEKVCKAGSIEIIPYPELRDEYSTLLLSVIR